MSNLPLPDTGAARELPGVRHAAHATREELAALASIKAGEQFHWRGDLYLATGDAAPMVRNGWQSVAISACCYDPAMRSKWALADVSASRPIEPGESGGGIAPELREAPLVQRRTADGGLQLFHAADLAGTAGELRARAADSREAGNPGLAYVQEREAERQETPEAFTPTAPDLLPDYGQDMTPGADGSPIVAPAMTQGEREELAAALRDAGELCRTRFEVTSLDASAEGMERLRNQSEFILLAYPSPYDTPAAIAEQWAADVDACERPDGFGFALCRDAVRTWAAQNSEYIAATLASLRDVWEGDDAEDSAPAFRLYVRDVDSDIQGEPNAEELAAEWDARNAESSK